MPVPLALLAYLETEARRERPHVSPGEKAPLARSGRIVGRFWRRSQAEKAAIAYREAGRRAVTGS